MLKFVAHAHPTLSGVLVLDKTLTPRHKSKAVLLSTTGKVKSDLRDRRSFRWQPHNSDAMVQVRRQTSRKARHQVKMLLHMGRYDEVTRDVSIGFID